MMIRAVILVASLFLVAPTLLAQAVATAAEDSTKPKPEAPKPEEVDSETSDKPEGGNPLDPLRRYLGAALSVTFDTGTSSRVEDAEIVNGIVRVKRDHDQIARVLLEAHKFIWFRDFGRTEMGTGFFVGVQPGSNDIIEAAAIGLMFGFRNDPTDRAALSLGIGIIGDPKVKILGDGFKENQAPPPGETQVRFKETGQGGVVILAGFAF